jgi:hypothetical protein
VLRPTDPALLFWESRSNGLRACSLLTTKELDLPQVESNLNKSPQEDLVVTVECIEVQTRAGLVLGYTEPLWRMRWTGS